MESEAAHSIAVWAGWIIAGLMTMLNTLLWSRLNRFDKELKGLCDDLADLKAVYLQRHADIKDLEIRMVERIGTMETKLVAELGKVQNHMVEVATTLRLKEERNKVTA